MPPGRAKQVPLHAIVIEDLKKYSLTQRQHLPRLEDPLHQRWCERDFKPQMTLGEGNGNYIWS